jgi:hypothetical protein
MPSKYLFLSNQQRIGAGSTDINPKWVNLPNLSQSSRECYLSVVNCKVVFDSTTTNSSLIVKAKIPALNYTSSDNQDIVVSFLLQEDKKIYTMEQNNDISILTNDGSLKNIEFVLEDNEGQVILLDIADSMSVMIKLDYVDQDAMTGQYLSELPKKL